MEGKETGKQTIPTEISKEQTFVDDSHDSWDAATFEATLKQASNSDGAEDERSLEPEAKKLEDSATNDGFKEKEWSEGTVFSIKSQKELEGASKQSALNRKTESFKVPALDAKDPIIEPVSPEPSLTDPEPPKQPDVVNKTAKDLALERQEARGGSPEQLQNFEKTYDSWKTAREKAAQAEKNFQDKHEAYLKEQSTGWRYYANMPRRAWGLQPKLTPELQKLYDESRSARADHHRLGEELESVKLLATGNTIERFKKVSARYQRMLAYHLTIGVHNKRLENQKAILAAADQNSFIGRNGAKAVEAVKKHKVLSIGAASVGAGVLIANAPIMAARVAIGLGVGLLTRGGVKVALDRTYVAGARKNLESGKANLGDDYFGKNFADSDKEMEKLMASVGKRESRAKTVATVAGAVAGFGAGYTAVEYMDGGVQNAMPPTEDRLVPPVKEMGDLSVMEEMRDNPYVKPAATEMGDLSVMEEMRDNPYVKPPVKEMGDLSVMEEMRDNPYVKPPVKEMGDLSVMEEMRDNPYVKPLPQEMGDASVAEAMSPKTQEIIGKIQSGELAQPEFKNVHPPYDGPKSHTPGGPGWEQVPADTEAKIDGSKVDDDLKIYSKDGIEQGAVEKGPAKPELENIEGDKPRVEDVTPPNDVPPAGLEGVPPGLESTDKFYIVQDTDKKGLWNVLEGNGPDNNPVGGQSEVLKGMPKMERWAALNTLLDYMEKNPEFVKEVGMLKGHGDINRLFPGENLNISLLDDKLRELLDLEVKLPDSAPLPETAPVDLPEVDKAVTPQSEIPSESLPTPPAPEVAVATDINEMTLGELKGLMERVVDQNDPTALSALEALGLDGGSARDLIETLESRNGEMSPETKIGDFLNNSEPNQSSYSEPAPQEPSPVISEASATINPEAKVSEYVKEIEKSRGGFFSALLGDTKPNVSGAFEQMKTLPAAQILEADAAGTQANGVTAEGWSRWVDTLKAQSRLIPIANGESLGQYITRVSSGNRVA